MIIVLYARASRDRCQHQVSAAAENVILNAIRNDVISGSLIVNIIVLVPLGSTSAVPLEKFTEFRPGNNIMLGAFETTF